MRPAAAVLLICACVTCGGGTALSDPAALGPRDFAAGMPVIAPGTSAAYRFPLPLAVYQDTVREDLGDLRVYNSQGEAVPYSLSQITPPMPSATATQALPLFPLRGTAHPSLNGVHLTIDSPGSAVIVRTGRAGATSPGVRQYIVDARALGTSIAALELSWPDTAEDYSGRLSVEASGDLNEWSTLVGGAPITNLHANGLALVTNRIELTPARSKFLRLSWLTPSPTFEFASVTAETTEGAAPKYDSLNVGGARDANDARIYTFDLGAHVPVSRVNLALPETNSMNRVAFASRSTPAESWRMRGVADVYRIATPDGERSNDPMTINGVRDRYWRVSVLQGGDLPSTPPRLVASYVPAEITFLAQGQGPFVLAFGSVKARSGESDLSRVAADADIGVARVGAMQTLGGPGRLVDGPAAFPWRRAALWGMLILAAGLLGWMAFRLSKDTAVPD